MNKNNLRNMKLSIQSHEIKYTKPQPISAQ